MKRFVRIFLFTVATLLGHLLFYSSGCDYQDVHATCINKYNFDTIISSQGCTDTVFFRDGKNSSESQNNKSAENLKSDSDSKNLKDFSPDDTLVILKSGKSLNNHSVCSYLSALSYHTSGTRASDDRLFILKSVRCWAHLHVWLRQLEAEPGNPWNYCDVTRHRESEYHHAQARDGMFQSQSHYIHKTFYVVWTMTCRRRCVGHSHRILWNTHLLSWLN